MYGIIAYTGHDQQTKQKTQLEFTKIKHSGPDETKFLDLDKKRLVVVFYHLRIIDTSSAGNQTFVLKENLAICNGEIFNHN